MSRDAGEGRVCPFCTAARQPSLCAPCLNQMTGERYEALAHLQSTKQALERKLARRIAQKERQAARRAQEEEAAIGRQRHARRMQHEQAQLREERSRIGELRLSVAVRRSRLEHAVSVMGRLAHSSAATLASAQASPLSSPHSTPDKEAGMASSAGHLRLEADQGLLNRLMLVTTARRKQAKDFLRELKEILPLRLAMSVPAALTRDTVLSAGGVRICNMPLPTSDALLCTLPSVELSTALGYFSQFLDLTAKYLSFPLLHRAGFGASTSRIWQRSSYWSPLPGVEYPLFKKGTSAVAHPARASEGVEGAGATTGEHHHFRAVTRATSLGAPQEVPEGYQQQGMGGRGRGETPWRQHAMGGGPQWDGYRMGEESQDSWPNQDLSTFSLASTSSSLFESPSWHALPHIPQGAAQLAGAWGSKGGPQGRGDPWQGLVPDAEVLELREGVLLLARSVACLCASHTFQPHGSLAPLAAFAPGAPEGEALGELGDVLVPFLKMLSALTREPRLGPDGASGLDSRWDAQGEVSSSMMASAAWEEGSFIGRDAGAGRAPASLHALAGARQLGPAALGPSAQALHDRHYESCSRLAHHQAQLGQAGARALTGSPIGLEAERRSVLGSSLVPDYIPPPLLGERIGVSHPSPPPGQVETRELDAGGRGFGIKLPLTRLLSSASPAAQGQAVAHGRAKGRGAEDEWDLVERVTLPPPPSRPEDVEHWTRAMILDVAK